METQQHTEPAIQFKELLSDGAYKLLNQLILDVKSTLQPHERIYDPKGNAAMVWNLFRGTYNFSFNQYKEVYDVLCATNQSTKRGF